MPVVPQLNEFENNARNASLIEFVQFTAVQFVHMYYSYVDRLQAMFTVQSGFLYLPENFKKDLPSIYHT